MATPLRALALCKTNVFLHYLKAPPHIRCLCSAATCLQQTKSPAVVPLTHAVPHSPFTQQTRSVTFFTSLTANEVWGGVTGVSNAGRKRGRGKRVGRKKVTDLNRGQVLGTGRANMLWPGLNAPIMKGREVLQQRQMEPNPEYEQELVRMRDQMGRITHPALPPLLRGWSGNRFPGQSVGPPDKVADYEFEGFDSKVLEFKLVTTMTGTLGRKQRFTAFVVVGNKNGLAGYGLGKGQNGKSAIRVAKNRAAQKLYFIDRFDDHTVFHNMYTKYHRTKIFIHKKEKGYGLKCHRALKTICELIGIEDLHCKVEGSTKNIKALTRGFFEALAQQETHSDLAERMGYHVVEMRPERGLLPVAVASPAGKVKQDGLKDEEEDLEVSFDRLYYGGKAEYDRPSRTPIYINNPSWHRKKRILNRNRNQNEAHLLRKAGLAQT